jgi:GNAT superfamily N-acetyltransferase
MTAEGWVQQATAAWVLLTGVEVTFPQPPDVRVIVAPGSNLCPPGWVGIIHHLDGATLVTAPDQHRADAVTSALARLPTQARTSPRELRALLPVTDVLGPATLAYLDHRDALPPSDPQVRPVAPGDPALLTVLAGCDPDDVAESSVHEVTHGVHVLHRAGIPLAAAGYRLWPGGIAHLCLLVQPDARNQGLGRAVASSAIRSALDSGHLPQWRARPAASQRVARSLGFTGFGSQLSIAVGG